MGTKRPASGLLLAPAGFGVIDEQGRSHEFAALAAALPWRQTELAPHEPRMPAHEYVVVNKLADELREVARLLKFVLDKHPASYRGYFRGYRTANRYLEPGDELRYWESWLRRRGGGGVSFLNRTRLDASEPPRRVDEGAKPIPAVEWGAGQPYWPQGSGYGQWKKEGGEWVFYPEEPPIPAQSSLISP